MKANFDFGNMKLEERNVVENFLKILLLSDFTFTNNKRAYDSNKERLFFRINNYYFSISFDKISFQDQIKIFNTLININKSNLLIKKVPSFPSNMPECEEEFKSVDSTVYFSSINDTSVLKGELLSKNFENICKKSLSLNKSFDVSLSVTLLANEIKKEVKGKYVINLKNNAILTSSALENKFFNSEFEALDDKFIFTLNENFSNFNNKIENREQQMEQEIFENEDNIEVKGELYIGTVDIDIKKLLSLKAGDKIVLDREDNITSILKIGSNEVLTGKLEFDEKNIKFIVESSNF